MTKLSTIAFVIAGGLALPLFAMSQSATAADANGDGVLTIDEVQAAYPDVTVETFSAMDLNADGSLEEGEITAAEEAGLMPTTEG